MGSASIDGYIQSHGWDGAVNGFQIKGGATPSINIIGGTITGSTIQTAASGQKVKIETPSVIFENAFSKVIDLRGTGTSERPALSVDVGLGGVMEVSNDLTISGSLTVGGSDVLTASNVGTYIALIPSQTGNNGKYLTTNGTTLSWANTPAPAGYNNSNWDTAYGWGNHANAGYLTPYSQLEWANVTNRTGYNDTNWNTAYGWGNHASAGYQASLGITGFGSGLTNDLGTLKVDFTTVQAAGSYVTTTGYNNSNWDSAYNNMITSASIVTGKQNL